MKLAFCDSNDAISYITYTLKQKTSATSVNEAFAWKGK